MMKAALQSREGQAYLGGAALTALVTALLALSTVETCLEQRALQEAALLAAQGKGEALTALRTLRSERPDDATVRVLLGALEYRRARDVEALDAARILFEEAFERDRARISAIAGLVATRLRAAEELPPEAREREAAQIGAFLEDCARGAYEPRHPDLIYLRGAVQILAGKPAAAIPDLEDDAPGGLLASLGGQGARYHNLALARILTRQGGAILPAGFGALSRPRGTPLDAEGRPGEGAAADPARLLTFAYRSDLADPQVAPSDAEALAARAQLATDLLPSRPPRTERAFVPAPGDWVPVINALGVGRYRAGNYAGAARAFALAAGQTRRAEPLYLLNEGQAAYRAALAAEPGSEDRRKLCDAAVGAFARICDLLDGQEGREGTLVLALNNAAAIALLSGDPKRARGIYSGFAEHHPSPMLAARDLGALEDHAGDARRAIAAYTRAIELQHPDSDRLQRRVDELRGR